MRLLKAFLNAIQKPSDQSSECLDNEIYTVDTLKTVITLVEEMLDSQKVQFHLLLPNLSQNDALSLSRQREQVRKRIADAKALYSELYDPERQTLPLDQQSEVADKMNGLWEAKTDYEDALDKAEAKRTLATNQTAAVYIELAA